jgi:DNA modification methylase
MSLEHNDKIVWVDINKVKPNPDNRNKHPDEQITEIVKQIKYQGWRWPIVVSNRSGLIAAGHGRLLAARKMDLTQVPVIYQDFVDEDQEIAFGVADNAIAKWAELDLAGINLDVSKLGPDFDISLLGIKDFEIDPADREGLGDEDEVPEKAPPRAKLGDVFLLGEHRLMCGDSTSIESVTSLMNGEKADLYLTDCPYGVSYESAGRRGKSNQHREIENDSKPLDEMKTFWQSVATAALENCTDEASYYWFACQGGDQMMMMMMMSLGDAGWAVKHELIWLKDQMCFGRADYHYKHEPIIYGWKRKGKHNWFGDRKQVSVIECPRPKKSDLHPTMKPIELLEHLLGNSSKTGSKVLDTFGGSGSTLIACEKTNRKCFMMELDPHYVDVIIARWEKYTGKTAVKSESEDAPAQDIEPKKAKTKRAK